MIKSTCARIFKALALQTNYNFNLPYRNKST